MVGENRVYAFIGISMISKKLTIELQEIIKTQYGLNLSFKETAKLGNDLVEVFDVLAQIDFKENLSNQKKDAKMDGNND